MCQLCNAKPVYEFTNKRKLCKRCFVRWFQKKFLYTIRKFKMISKEDIIGYQNSENLREVVLEDVLKMFADKTDVELVKLPSKKKIKKIAVSSTIDSNAYNFVSKIINYNIDDLSEIAPKNEIVIKPLYLFLDKEILLYAKLRKLKFKKEKSSKNKIDKFIDKLEVKHPEVKRAIVKGFLKLY